MKAARPRSRNPPERALQVAVAGYLDRHPVTRTAWFHYPSGGFRKPETAHWLRKQGAKPGVPDILIFRPFVLEGRTFHGLAIELKKLGANGLSPCQNHWMRSLWGCGWLCAIARTFKDVRALVERAYGPLPPRNSDTAAAPPPWLARLWRAGGFDDYSPPDDDGPALTDDTPPDDEHAAAWEQWCKDETAPTPLH